MVLLNLIGVEFVLLLLLLLLLLVVGYGCVWAIARAADVVFDRKMLRLRVECEPADVEAPFDSDADDDDDDDVDVDDDEFDGLTVLNCNWMSIM